MLYQTMIQAIYIQIKHTTKTKEDQDKITHEIIGSSMEVQSILGNGFQEVF